MGFEKIWPSKVKKDADKEIKERVQEMAEVSSKVTGNPLTVAFIGFAGHGKSSYLNTIASYSCLPRKLKQLARAGHGERTVTTHITPHELVIWDAPSHDNHNSNIVLLDTPGHFCKKIMLENMQHEEAPQDVRAQLMRQNIVNLLVGDLHRRSTTCVVIVVSAQQVLQSAMLYNNKRSLKKKSDLQIPDNDPTYQSLQTLKEILNVAGHHGMRSVCILTHCDLVNKAVGKDAEKDVQSSVLDCIRTYVANQLGLANNLVYPILNLLQQPDPASNLEVGSVALAAFCNALTAAQDGRNEIATRERWNLKNPGDEELTVLRAGPDMRGKFVC